MRGSLTMLRPRGGATAFATDYDVRDVPTNIVEVREVTAPKGSAVLRRQSGKCPPTERRTYAGEPFRRLAPDTAAMPLMREKRFGGRRSPRQGLPRRSQKMWVRMNSASRTCRNRRPHPERFRQQTDLHLNRYNRYTLTDLRQTRGSG